MEYNEPWGANTNDPYFNGIPSLGIEGSVIPAEAVENPQREIVRFIQQNDMLPTNEDLNQLGRGVQLDLPNYGIDYGVANAMAVSLDPAPITYHARFEDFHSGRGQQYRHHHTQRQRSGRDAGAAYRSAPSFRRAI